MCSPFLQQEGKKSQYQNGTDLTLPINHDKALTLMKYNPSLYDRSKVTDEYYRYFEVAVGNWITRANASYSNSDYKTYQQMIGGRMDTTSDHSNIFQGKLQSWCGENAWIG